MNENLFEIFRRSFPADLGRIFLERPDGSVLSYADLLDLSAASPRSSRTWASSPATASRPRSRRAPRR